MKKYSYLITKIVLAITILFSQLTAPCIAMKLKVAKNPSLNWLTLQKKIALDFNKNLPLHIEQCEPNTFYFLTKNPTRPGSRLLAYGSYLIDLEKKSQIKHFYTTYYNKDTRDEVHLNYQKKATIDEIGVHDYLFDKFCNKNLAQKISRPIDNQNITLHCEQTKKIVITKENIPQTVYHSETLIHFLIWHPQKRDCFVFANEEHLIFVDLIKQTEIRFPLNKGVRVKDVAFHPKNFNLFMALCVQKNFVENKHSMIFFKKGNLEGGSHENLISHSNLMRYDKDKPPVLVWNPPSCIMISNVIDYCPCLLIWEIPPPKFVNHYFDCVVVCKDEKNF